MTLHIWYVNWLIAIGDECEPETPGSTELLWKSRSYTRDSRVAGAGYDLTMQVDALERVHEYHPTTGLVIARSGHQKRCRG